MAVLIALSVDGTTHGEPQLLAEGTVTVIADALRQFVRTGDVLCGITPSRFGVLLIETAPDQAKPALARLSRFVHRDLPSAGCVRRSAPMLAAFGRVLRMRRPLVPRHVCRPDAAVGEIRAPRRRIDPGGAGEIRRRCAGEVGRRAVVRVGDAAWAQHRRRMSLRAAREKK